MPQNPPSFDASKVITSKYRFQASSALSRVAITGEDLLDLLCMATSAIAAYQICSSTKIASVKIWGPMASNLTPVEVAIEYAGASVGAPTSVRSATSMGSAKAASLSYPPPAESLAAFWINSGGSALFYLTGPSGSVVDITLMEVIQNDTAATAVGGAVAGATTGAVYVRALDSNGSSLLPPLSYRTI